MSSVASRLALATTTHLVPSAPSTWILRRTVASVRRRLRTAGCEHRVYYDAPRAGGERHERYLANLRAFCGGEGLELLVRPGSGLKSNYLHAVDAIRVPYMLFLEHDWVFRRDVDLAGLLDAFDRHPFIHYVKFNKMANDARYMWDHFVEPEDRVPEFPLTRTSGWSNNPHVVRLAKWHSSWKAVVGPAPAQGSHGIEEALYWRYGRGIFTEGFRETHADWGVMIHGPLDAPALVKHTNGSLSADAWREPFAKARRFAGRAARRLREAVGA